MRLEPFIVILLEFTIFNLLLNNKFMAGNFNLWIDANSGLPVPSVVGAGYNPRRWDRRITTTDVDPAGFYSTVRGQSVILGGAQSITDTSLANRNIIFSMALEFRVNSDGHNFLAGDICLGLYVNGLAYMGPLDRHTIAYAPNRNPQFRTRYLAEFGYPTGINTGATGTISIDIPLPDERSGPPLLNYATRERGFPIEIFPFGPTAGTVFSIIFI